jgi:hypothetical protein
MAASCAPMPPDGVIPEATGVWNVLGNAIKSIPYAAMDIKPLMASDTVKPREDGA